MSNNALTIYGQFDQLQRAAKALYASKFFNDAKSEAQAIVKVMAGAELGLPPFASMTGIHIIHGKPALGSNAVATLVKNDPRYDYRVVTCDNQAAVLVWFEEGVEVGESTFTIEEAKGAGLTSKDNWKKYPSDMLFARALTRGARRHAPGIFGGAPVYTPDELGADTDEDGNIIEGEVTTYQHRQTPDEEQEYRNGLEEALEDEYRDGLGADSLLVDCRTWLEDKINGGRTNLSMVIDAVAMTKLFENNPAIVDEIKKFENWPDSYKYTRSQELKGESALTLFDWLVERKAD